jgi:hypothetical protein
MKNSHGGFNIYGAIWASVVTSEVGVQAGLAVDVAVGAGVQRQRIQSSRAGVTECTSLVVSATLCQHLKQK